MNSPPARPLSLAIWNFSSSWFLIPQGTSIIAAILHQVHYRFGALSILAEIVWIYAIVLLGLGPGIYLLRVFLYPKHVLREIRRNVVEASCLSSIPIAFTSIIQMIALQYNESADLVAYVYWWISTALSIIAAIGVPYLQLKMQPSGIEHLPPSFLLPVISILTSAAGGGTICENSVLSARLRVPAIIVSHMELGAGIPLAICIGACILYHHYDHTYPQYDKAYQDMVLCGPFGQASFALQILGLAVQHSFGEYGQGMLLTVEAASPIAAVSQFVGLFAIMSIVYTLYMQPGGWRKISFSLTTWSLIFSWGVYTNAAVRLVKLMDSPAFDVWSTALLLMLVLLWIVVTLFTLKGTATGRIFRLEDGWKVRKSKQQIV
ncbi:hypothetical protein BDV12DRAFT_187943 [Aspergillus spectabilis]